MRLADVVGGAMLAASLLAGCESRPTAGGPFDPDTATVVMRDGDRVRVAGTTVGSDNQVLRIGRGEAIVFAARWDAVKYVEATAKQYGGR